MLADLRPNARMLADLEATVGIDAGVRRAAGLVPRGLLQQRVLADGAVRLEGELADVDAPAVRTRLEREHARLLAEHGMDHLNISEVRSRDRPVTQAVSRALFEHGAAGVVFGSNHDDRPCYALFEGRGALVQDAGSTVVELHAGLDVLRRVCDEYGLRIGLRSAPAG